ncbi:MAG: ABC transporter ATP-binding protein [Chitinophagales bacterium]
MIQFQGVSKSFGMVKALDNLNIIFNRGKIIGLFGPNGAGKSTTLKLATGINRPDQGVVTVDDQAPANYKDHIAYLPEVDHLYSWMTLKQAAQFMQSFYADWNESKYRELVTFLNLHEGMKLAKISKGQRAKCKLLLAVSRQSPYLFLDEPLSGIDILTRDQIIQTLIRDFRDGEQTIIISTHEIRDVENLVDEVVFLNQGKIHLAGDAEELRANRGTSLVEIMKEAFRDAN